MEQALHFYADLSKHWGIWGEGGIKIRYSLKSFYEVSRKKSMQVTELKSLINGFISTRRKKCSYLDTACAYVKGRIFNSPMEIAADLYLKICSAPSNPYAQ